MAAASFSELLQMLAERAPWLSESTAEDRSTGLFAEFA